MSQGSPTVIADPEDEALSPKDLEAFLNTATDRFKRCVDAESTNRATMVDDIEFSHGGTAQWPTPIYNDRTSDIANPRPCLTINQLPKFIRQVTNEVRQNRPGINVHPVSDGADEDTADVFQDLIRHIQEASDADAAYDTASDRQVRGGLGFIRVLTQYCDERSFDQEAVIKRVRNPFTIYIDPDAQEIDGSDARFAFVTDDMTPQKYKELYPDTELASLSNFSGMGNLPIGWFSDATIRVAEYFVLECKKKKIYQLQDGSVVDALPEGMMAVNERESEERKVMHYLINAVEIIEKSEWPGKYIPIIPVIGEENDINGKRTLSGMVRDAKDPQRMYNFWASAKTEMIALAPKAPFVMVEGQDEGYETEWQLANRKSYSVLHYRNVSLNGTPAPPPQRNQAEPPVQAITMSMREAAEDLKAVTGIYDASLGARSNETSGVAIKHRQAEGDTANYHFPDNLNRAIKHVGRILVDIIPKIYDAPRVIRIIGEDGTRREVAINQIFQEDGQDKIYDMTAGKYDVVIEAGPSFATKRQEAVEGIMGVVQAYPEIMQIAGDILLKNMDWPEAQKISERMKMAIPPAIRGPDDEAGDTGIPPEVKAHLDKSHQMIEQLTEALNKAHDDLGSKKMDNDSKERIAYLNAQVALITTLATLDSAENKELLKHEIGAVTQRLSMLNNVEDRQHAQDMQGMQQQHDASMAEAAAQQNSVDSAAQPMASDSQGASGA